MQEVLNGLPRDSDLRNSKYDLENRANRMRDLASPFSHTITHNADTSQIPKVLLIPR